MALAQLEPPDRKYLFVEDKLKGESEKKEKEALRSKKQQLRALRREGDALPFDIEATNLSYDSTNNTIRADGGLIITYSSSVVEAEWGEINVESNEAKLSGDIRISDVNAKLSADTAELNLETGAGNFREVDIYFTEGDYRLRAKRANKIGQEVYDMQEAMLTTCRCPEGEDCVPWSFQADEAKITRNGYGQVWDAWLQVHDAPVLYVPYLFFPAKSERQTGFLPATFGSGRRSGFSMELPFYWVIDDSTDVELRGILETKVRRGLDSEFRKIFSRTHRLDFGLIYLNEKARNGALIGTNTDGLADPTLKENRIAGFLQHSWRGSLAGQPLQFLVDGRYIADDLFLREFEKDKIGDSSSRFVTSRASFRAPLFDTYSLDLSSEFNQSIVSDDDFVFQRAPQLSLDGFSNFRPFGENPMGLKLVLNSSLNSTNFVRKRSFEGIRSEAYERLRMPFHYRNFFDGELGFSVRSTLYNLTDEKKITKKKQSEQVVESTEDPLDDEKITFLDRETDRVVPALSFKLSTVLEQVFDVSEKSLIKKIGELGRLGRNEQLVRLKHTIEPKLSYLHVPFVDQSDTPQFDSKDHLTRKNILTYGLTQRLYVRYEPRDEYLYGIEETAPEVEDMGNLRSRTLVDQDYGFGILGGGGDEYVGLRRGSVKEFVTFKLSQSLDLDEVRKDEKESTSGLSDLAASLLLSPNEYFVLSNRTDFDVEDRNFRSYSVEGRFSDKRGDQLRTRLRFVENNVRQLETSLEIRLTEHLRLGSYSRYDDMTSKFIESRAGLRIESDCKCWLFDILVTDKINPDETKFSFNVTLVGLGEVGNTFFSRLRDEQEE